MRISLEVFRRDHCRRPAIAITKYGNASNEGSIENVTMQQEKRALYLEPNQRKERQLAKLLLEGPLLPRPKEDIKTKISGRSSTIWTTDDHSSIPKMQIKSLSATCFPSPVLFQEVELRSIK